MAATATANEQYTRVAVVYISYNHMSYVHQYIMLHGYDTTTYVRVSGGGRTGQGDDDSSSDELHGSNSIVVE